MAPDNARGSGLVPEECPVCGATEKQDCVDQDGLVVEDHDQRRPCSDEHSATDLYCVPACVDDSRCAGSHCAEVEVEDAMSGPVADA